MEYFASLEQTFFSIWIRETGWFFFSVLILHSLGMAFAVGINIAVNLRVLGVASRAPIHLMRRFMPIHHTALAAILVSGILLILAYPAKALTNIVFYVKILALGSALAITWHFSKSLMTTAGSETNRQSKLLAALALLLWFAGISAGRFLAYTHSILLASSFY
ncbi:MAG: hypothetical protein WDZ76_02160 [Pseudohongiellaceae bacterium]